MAGRPHVDGVDAKKGYHAGSTFCFTFHEVKGKVRQKAGQAAGNPDVESKGQSENIAGKVQKKIGQIEKVFEK
jgi:uncharacterized protein YjbJ (UPF0337 family)